MESSKIDYSWQKGAACLGLDPAMFYPSHGKKSTREAAEACYQCPVKAACLQHALKYEEYGFWAGTSARKRVAMRAELGIELVVINSLWLNAIPEEQKPEPIKIKGRGRKVAECGTRAGYNAHLRKKETTCDACRAAQTKSIIEFNQNKKAAQV